MGFNAKNRDFLLNDLYNLAPGNLEICDNLVRIFLENEKPEMLEEFFDAKTREHINQYEKLGNVYFCWADLHHTLDQNEKALMYFRLAEENYLKCFDKKHSMVKTTNDAIKQLKVIMSHSKR